jgi:hypothetical protein
MLMTDLMTDLRSKKLIVLKGCLFACIAMLCAASLIAQHATLRTVALLGVLLWSACRFYYFLFYVLAAYVDPTLKYAGILALLRWLRRRDQH